LYHLSAAGSASWFDFAQAIIGDVQRPRVVPIATSEYPTAARRPAYAVLATARFERTFGFALPHWRDTLARCRATEADAQGRIQAFCLGTSMQVNEADRVVTHYRPIYVHAKVAIID
jgi:hypothetical protein